MEIIFVLAFFLFIFLTGISLLGIVISVFAAGAILLFAGLFYLVLKLLPWLLLALIVAWVVRALGSKMRSNDNSP